MSSMEVLESRKQDVPHCSPFQSRHEASKPWWRTGWSWDRPSGGEGEEERREDVAKRGVGDACDGLAEESRTEVDVHGPVDA